MINRYELIVSRSGLGAIVAQKFAAEGSNIAINYLSSKDTAENVAADLANKYNVKTITVQGVCFLLPLTDEKPKLLIS